MCFTFKAAITLLKVKPKSCEKAAVYERKGDDDQSDYYGLVVVYIPLCQLRHAWQNSLVDLFFREKNGSKGIGKPSVKEMLVNRK